ncbi:MAG: hypothetical protein ABIV26_07835 [Candidatus Limnocylindrales bacterium]
MALLLIIPSVGLLFIACGSAGASVPAPIASAHSTTPSSVATPASTGHPGSASPSEGASSSPEPESGGLTSGGDVPDNAVFLTYRGGTPAFSIQYVEGWQVTPQSDGAVIRDKDSSETVSITTAPPDLSSWIAATDLPSLEAQAGFKLDMQDRVKVGGATYDHLVYHLPAPPDPVTGKQVPSTIDRYYVPGSGSLGVVSLSTPDGVDNVDAFRLMIESFTWH